jgi:hypothetical protein
MGVTDKDSLCKHFLRHIGDNPTFELLLTLTSKVFPPVLSFLAGVDASTSLIGLLSDDEVANCRPIALLSSLLRANVRSDVLLKPLQTCGQADNFFRLAIGAKDSIYSASLASLLHDIVDRDISGALRVEHDAVVDLLRSKIPDICGYILNGKRYTQAHSAFVLLVIRLVQHVPAPDSVFELAGGMFEMVLVQEGHSFLHADFLALIKCVGITTEFVEKWGICDKIGGAFENRSEKRVVYWAALHELTNFVIATAVQVPETLKEAWKGYCEGPFAEMSDLLARGYGGVVPGEEPEEEEEQYEYEYEEEAGEGEGE